jgi:WD40 repeat protein
LDHTGLLLAWDLAGGRPLWHVRLPLERDAPPRAGLAFSPDGRTLLAPLLGRGLVALDSATGQQRYTLAGEAPLALRFTSGGALIWGGVAGGLARSKPPGALPEPLAGITAGPVLAISPGGDLVQLGAQLLGVERANLVGNPAGDGLRAAAFFPQSQRLVRVGKQAAIIDSASGKRLVELKGHEGDLLAAAVSPDGRLVSAGGAGGAVYVWEARTGKARPALKGHKGAVNALCFTPDGKRLLSAGEDAVVLVWGL